MSSDDLKLVKYNGGKFPLEIDGVKFKMELVDSGLRSVTIIDSASGDFVRIEKDGTYTDNLKLLKAKPVQMTDVYDVAVTLNDGTVMTKKDMSSQEKDDYLRSLDWLRSTINFHLIVKEEVVSRSVPVDEDEIPF